MRRVKFDEREIVPNQASFLVTQLYRPAENTRGRIKSPVLIPTRKEMSLLVMYSQRYFCVSPLRHAMRDWFNNYRKRPEKFFTALS